MKKILFLNTTKLAVLSAMLLLAVFCTIGMSFTPAEEGENVGNPNDSTYVTGPRRSSSSSCSGWSTEYQNATDYGRVEVKIMVWKTDGTPDEDIDHSTVGSVTLTGETAPFKATDGNTYQASITSSNPTSGTDVFIDWNSDTKWTNEWAKQNKSDNIIKACHTLNVTMEAITEAITNGTVYEFYGWTKHIMQNDKETYSRAFPSTKPTKEDGLITDEKYTNDIILGDVDGSGDEDGFTNTYTDGHKATWENPDEPHKVIYYAHFAPPVSQTITLKAAKNGTYTYTDGAESGMISNTDGSITTSKQITLTATPASGCEFFGWYEKDGDKEKYLSYAATWKNKFTVPTTIYAKFIPKDAALFIIKDGDGTEYWNLNEACTKALSSSKVVLPKDNGTLYPLVDGELCTNPEGKTITPYTIPSGVTLLIPYDDDNSIYTKPEQKHESNTSPSSKPTCYCLLTLHDLCTISVNGTLNIAANIFSAYGGNYCSGSVFSKYGRLDMKKDSKININSSAKLYCWGFITGTEGLVTVKGEVNEMFQMHNPGGGQLSKWKNKALFITQYYIQNIETPMRIYSGATETVHATVYIYSYINTNATLVGEDGLFRLIGEESYFEKRYDPITDRQIFEINGSAELNYLSLTVLSYSISTEKVPLPISNNITILSKVLPKEESSTLTCNYDVALLPGSELIIDKGVKVENKASIYIYDQEEWKEGFAGLNSDLLKPVRFSPTKNITRTKDDLIDAKFEINGTLNIASNGAIYTTIDNERTRKGSANICSAGTGIIKYNGNAGTETETYLYAKNDLSTPVTIPITAAQLHNDESKTWNQDEKYKYTPTAGAVANDVFTYSETYGRWRCERTITWEANGGTIEPLPTIVGKGEPLSLYFPESLPTPTRVGYTFNGWFTAASGGDKISTETVVNNNVTYYAQWTLNIVGTPLDIVDADGTNLTINTNGWASSRWSYTINGTLYEKTARQADRTLVIPYDGQPNDDMLIVVKNESDEVISNHMYKVPFVYTGNATMSGTDANSIVFVKSGTLSIEGDASAKEIYVAPGAELKVNGTLTVVDKLVLRTTPYKAAILTNNGTINGQVFYSRISPDAKQYYQFGLPLSCPLASVQMSNTGKLGGSQPKYGTAWMLKSYSESSRANNGIKDDGANWSLLPSEGTIAAGVGYEMFSNSNYYREFYFPVTLPTEPTTTVSVSYTPDGAEGAAHAGWNIITSPLTSRATVTIGDPATAIKVCWLKEDGSYRQEQPTVIPPAIPFSYQASAGGYLNFVSTIAAAPRKQSAAEALTETEWVHLDIFDAYGEGDETSLFVHPTRFEQTYKTGIDMAKQSLTASRAILYTTHAYGDMAFAGVADSLLENGIDLVVYSPSAQELTFSLRENKFLNRLEYLWLADNETGARTDLLMDDYTFRADAGTAKGRFVLNGRFKAPQISTGIGNTQTDYNIYAIGNNIAISGVEQGTPIYVFDAVGHMIYTTAATSDEVIVPAPCAGVYMLSVGGQTAKLVVNQ